MRSFAVLAMAAAATASYIPSSAPPAYEETPAPYVPSSTEYPAYPESSKAPEYPAYPESSKAPEYPAYPVSSKAPEYPAEYPTEYETTTVTGISTVCSETGKYTYGTKTYEVTKPTTIIDEECVYTTSYPVKPTGYPVHTPVHSEYAPEPYHPAPSSNATVPHPTGYTPPTSAKPSLPEFTGAAGKASVGLLAIVGAVAAFL